MDDLIKQNISIVHGAIRKYFPSRAGDEDTIQEGMIGLWEALKTYDPEKAELTTYAYRLIKQRIIKMIQYEKRQKRTAEVLSLDYTYDETDLHNYVPAERDIPYFALKDYISKIKTPRHRKIMTLLFKGYNQRQTAKLCDCSHQLVSHVKFRHEGAIREILK